MSIWEELSVETCIRQVLGVESRQSPHLGRPYLTAYQIASAIARDHPETHAAINKPIGGKGKGKEPGHSLAQYIANQLSRRIKSGRIKDIEGGFLYSDNMKKLMFRSSGGDIQATTRLISMFRLKNN